MIENEKMIYVLFGMLPSHYPKWQLVYYYYSKWYSLELFDLLLSSLQEKVRFNLGLEKEAELGIADNQSVRWGNNRSLNGFDGNKKVKGIKRHVVVDKNSFLIVVMVSTANVHVSKAAILLMKTLQYLLITVKVILADGGYRGSVIEEVRKSLAILFRSLWAVTREINNSCLYIKKMDYRKNFFLV